jgi:phosphatidylglycerophosphatase A
MRYKPVLQWIATMGRVGYLPQASGTAGSLVGLLLGCFGTPSLNSALTHPPWSLAALAIGFVLGVVAATTTEHALGTHDPSAVVIDEVWGMWAVVVILPVVKIPVLALVAFGLFRAFDIVKPPPLRWLARLPGGWGIMLDDAGAAAYTLLLIYAGLHWHQLAL